MTAATATMCSAIRRASSASDRGRDRVAGARGREDRAPVVRRSERRLPPGREPLRDGGQRSRARVDVLVEPRRARSRARPRRRCGPRWSSPRSTSPAPSPVPIEMKTKSSTPRATPRQRSPSAARLMSFSTVTGQPERARRSSLPKLAPLEAGDVRASRTVSRAGSTAPGHADDDAVDRDPRRDRRPRRSDVAQAGDRASSTASASAPPSAPSSTSCRARISPRRSQSGAAQEARAEVEAEDERRLGHRLEEDGAVARAARRRAAPRGRGRLSSSACSASETVGFEMPARREISAREIGGAGADRLEHGALVELA